MKEIYWFKEALYQLYRTIGKLAEISPDAILLELPIEWFEKPGAPIAGLKFLNNDPGWQYCNEKK